MLLPLLHSRAFLLVCLLSFACTIIRETFFNWTPVYLRAHLGYRRCVCDAGTIRGKWQG
jgi:hypothetical protein